MDARVRPITLADVEGFRACVDASGFEKIELSVYATNAPARALYERVGFVLEGTRVRGRKVDGRYDDVHMMAWFPPAPA